MANRNSPFGVQEAQTEKPAAEVPGRLAETLPEGVGAVETQWGRCIWASTTHSTGGHKMGRRRKMKAHRNQEGKSLLPAVSVQPLLLVCAPCRAFVCLLPAAEGKC